MSTIEDLLSEISERGWRLNNLFQLDDGRWRANIRDACLGYTFGQGHTPVEALNRAIDMAEEGDGATLIDQGPPSFNIDNSVTYLRDSSFRDLKELIFGPPQPSGLKGRI